MTVDRTTLWVVDRVEGDALVIVEDETGRTEEVPRRSLAAGTSRPAPDVAETGVAPTERAAGISEGSVLRVPLGRDGAPVWADAVVDEAVRRARIEEAERLLDELKRRDPGGDIAV